MSPIFIQFAFPSFYQDLDFSALISSVLIFIEVVPLEKLLCRLNKSFFFCDSVLGSPVIPPSPSGPYGVSPDQLASMNRDHNIAAFEQYGGARLPFFFTSIQPVSVMCALVTQIYVLLIVQVKGISGLLRTNFETGISGDDHEFAQRRDVFGSNTYPLKKGRTFWVKFCIECYLLLIHLGELKKLYSNLSYNVVAFNIVQMFLWDAWQDTTLIILIVAAIASLGLGIKTEVTRIQKYQVHLHHSELFHLFVKSSNEKLCYSFIC